MKTEYPAGFAALRILHLEASPQDCDLVEDAVTAAGLNGAFTHAATGKEFAEALARETFDLILSDYGLPDYDGASALVRARRLQPDTPLILVSENIGEERAIEVLRDGAADLVLKSRLNRLGAAIRRALQQARERTGRRLAEHALRQSEERLREMAENIREVFWSASADGRQIHYVSPAYAQIWGRSLLELQARPESWHEPVWAEDKPKLMRLRGLLAQGFPYNLEFRIKQPDGTSRWIEERGYPVRSSRGDVERIVGVAHDVTERKHLEAQLQQAQKMESIGQLAGGIAHDFSNMLTVINGYANLLLDRQDLPPHVVESLKHIFVAGGRAANLTRQLLIFSRKSHPNNQSLDLNEVVEAVIAMLRRMIGENIRLDVDLARPLPRIMADAGMLEQIMMNLAVNARDAMPKGGSLVLSTGSCEATAADCAQNPEAKPGAYVMLGVRDTGYGIPPEILPRIFEPFFTTKDEGKGTGLGLATVFGIARQHQGWVEVESEVGTGTLFQVFFPVATEAQSTHVSPSSGNFLLTGGKETILLVEDEESVRSFARTVLEMHGYKVLEAGTGIEALDAWKWHHDKISLLLTDLVLPDEITGHELAERLQVEKPELRVLYSSGYNPAQARDVLKLKTGFCFLQKPYQPKTLARIVREVLDNGTVNTTSPSQTPFA